MVGDPVTGLIASLMVQRSESFAVEVDLEIGRGETVALLGPNGAGKSTVVAAISGLVPVDSGHIELGGRILDRPETGEFVVPEDRSVGVVFQDFLLFSHMTVLDNVAFGLAKSGRRGHDPRTAARVWTARLGLEKIERSSPDDLSGGEAQRVALARALASEPAALLLDEPLSSLDVSTRAEVRDTLKLHLADFDGPRLLITHDPTDAYLLADRIYLLEAGRVTQSGTADDIRLRPKTQYAADLTGANLFQGTAAGGGVIVGGHVVRVADKVPDGGVLLTVPPTAVSVHNDKPSGSPRNTWSTTVEVIEHLGPRARLRTGPPLSLTVELTEAALAELQLAPGSPVWIAIKATEVTVEPLRPNESLTN